jgi:Uma2 family endonuclease
MATEVRNATETPAADPWKNAVMELIPPQGAWTEDAYLVLTAHSNRLVEFTDGFLEILPMPTEKHQSILFFLCVAFHNFIEPRGGKVSFAGLRLRIRDGKLREPDILLVRSIADPRRNNKIWDGADLVLEVVSEDNPERDVKDKRGDYAEARIPEYWIVNPMDETITVLRLAGSAYEEFGVYRRGQSAVSNLLPEFSVDVSATFDAE